MNALVIHRSQVVAHGLCKVLEEADITSESTQWTNDRTFASQLRAFEPDVVLADPQIEGLNLGHLVDTVSMWNDETPVAIVSVDQAPGLMQTGVSAGAAGNISLDSTPAEFAASLELIAAGQVVASGDDISTLADVAVAHRSDPIERKLLTDRESLITKFVALGLTNGAVAEQLGVSEGTIKVHNRNIFRKLGISNRAELTGFALRSGMIN